LLRRDSFLCSVREGHRHPGEGQLRA
jgi:hypothetical protein